MNAAAGAVQSDQNDRDAREALIGATGRHARVLLFTVTDKEFPVARRVLEQFGSLEEVESTGAYTFEDCIANNELPFVLVQSDDRTNLYAQSSVSEWIRDFRPQYILVIGTAGGIHRPADNTEPYEWAGPQRGDVVVSEYVHYAEFMKVSTYGNLMRHLPIEQPLRELVKHARGVIRTGSWTNHLGDFRKAGDRIPVAKIEEILSGDAVQDNPLDPMQQFLMEHFDRAGAIEMESAGVAQCLHVTRNSVHYAPGFLTIRGVSDIVYARGPWRPLCEKDLPESSQGKTKERDKSSPVAAASASAFAVALTARLVKTAQPPHPGHRQIDGYAMPRTRKLSDLPDRLGS